MQAESSDVAVSDEVTVERLREVADELFGLDELRPAQVEAAAAVLDGRDVLLILPTGAGKSLAYQLAAVLINGPTLVVSPLLALQRDQIDRLDARGQQTRAVPLSSAETPAQRAQALAEVADGAEFLFLAPEQLANVDVLEHVADLEPTLVAVDEAHCVSTWGHDFRPDYLRLGELIEQLGAPRIVELTATAAPPVRDDIVSRLRLKRPLTIVKGLARDNIALSVERCVTGEDQERSVRERVLSTAGPGIVYVSTRKAAEEYADSFVKVRPAGRGVPRGAAQGPARRRPGPVFRRRYRRDRGDVGVRDGARQARHPVRVPCERAGLAGLLRGGVQ